MIFVIKLIELPKGNHFLLVDAAFSLAEATAFLIANGTDIVIHKGGSAVAVKKINGKLQQ